MLQVDKLSRDTVNQALTGEGDEPSPPPIIALSVKMILEIFSHFDDLQTFVAVAGTCRSFRFVVRGMREISRFHLLIEDVVEKIFQTVDSPSKLKVKRVAAKRRTRMLWNSMFSLRRKFRNEIFPQVPLSALSSLEGGFAYPDFGVIRFLCLKSSLVERWRSELFQRGNSCVCIRRRSHFTDFSFQALLEALKLAPHVTKLCIQAPIHYLQMKMLLDTSVTGNLSIKEIELDLNGMLERRTLLAFVGLLATLPQLEKIEMGGVMLDNFSLALLAKTLKGIPRLTHLSLEFPDKFLNVNEFGEFLQGAVNLDYLHIGKIIDKTFLALVPYLVKSRIPTLSFRKGDLSSRAVEGICRLVETNRALKHLDLVQNRNICEEGAVRIVRAARRRPDLSFAISENMFMIH